MSASTKRTSRRNRLLLTLLVLALLAFTLQSLVFSGASFTSSTTNPGNSTLAGTLSHVNSRADQVVLNAADIRPGVSRQGTLSITGQGDFPAQYTISRASLTDTPASPALSDALTLTIADVTGAPQTLWTGTMGSFTSVVVPTVIAPGDTRQFRFTIAWPLANDDPALQDATSAMVVTFTGVQQ